MSAVLALVAGYAGAVTGFRLAGPVDWSSDSAAGWCSAALSWTGAVLPPVTSPIRPDRLAAPVGCRDGPGTIRIDQSVGRRGIASIAQADPRPCRYLPLWGLRRRGAGGRSRLRSG